MGSSTFQELYNELILTFPDLPPQQAKRFINRAQRETFDHWPWSFLISEGNLNVPASVNAGTVTVVQGSNLIVADATAATAWQNLGLFVPITQRCLKIGPDLPYEILAFDGVNTVYIDRPFTGTSGAAITYSMYRPYYTPPSPDFNRWCSIVDTTNQMNVIKNKPREWLDWVDPQRSNIGTPAQFISFYRWRPAQVIPAFGALSSDVQLLQTPLWELWPCPTNQMSFQVYYKRAGADLVNSTDVSDFDDEVLVSKALYHCYRFAQVNPVKFSQVRGQKIDWRGLMINAKADYMEAVAQQVKRDDNVNLQSVIKKRGPFFPGSKWYTSHLTWGEYNQAFRGWW